MDQSGEIKPVSHPSLTTSQCLSPTSYSSACWSDQVHARFKQIQAGIIWLHLASASRSPSKHHSSPAPKLFNANQGLGAHSYLLHTHVFATQTHAFAGKSSPLGHSWPKRDRSQWIHASSFQPPGRQFWDAFYKAPQSTQDQAPTALSCGRFDNACLLWLPCFPFPFLGPLLQLGPHPK